MRGKLHHFLIRKFGIIYIIYMYYIYQIKGNWHYTHIQSVTHTSPSPIVLIILPLTKVIISYYYCIQSPLVTSSLHIHGIRTRTRIYKIFPLFFSTFPSFLTHSPSDPHLILLYYTGASCFTYSMQLFTSLC